MNEESKAYQSKVKATFDKKTKKCNFKAGDLVLRWDARREDKFKHGKFDILWFGPFKIAKVLNNNTFLLYNLDDSEILGGPVNGWFLKPTSYKTSRVFQFVQYGVFLFWFDKLIVLNKTP